MAGDWNNPWKLTAIGMALVVVTALVTGLVVAQWSGSSGERKTVELAQPTTTAVPTTRRAESTVPAPTARRAAPAPAQPHASTVPIQAAVEACHQETARAGGPAEQDGGGREGWRDWRSRGGGDRRSGGRHCRRRPRRGDGGRDRRPAGRRGRLALRAQRQPEARSAVPRGLCGLHALKRTHGITR